MRTVAVSRMFDGHVEPDGDASAGSLSERRQPQRSRCAPAGRRCAGSSRRGWCALDVRPAVPSAAPLLQRRVLHRGTGGAGGAERRVPSARSKRGGPGDRDAAPRLPPQPATLWTPRGTARNRASAGRSACRLGRNRGARRRSARAAGRQAGASPRAKDGLTPAWQGSPVPGGMASASEASRAREVPVTMGTEQCAASPQRMRRGTRRPRLARTRLRRRRCRSMTRPARSHPLLRRKRPASRVRRALHKPWLTSQQPAGWNCEPRSQTTRSEGGPSGTVIVGG